MCRLDKEFPGDVPLHLVLDNYGTHKHEKVRSWLQRHSRFELHFVPTSSSWLNLVERWFGELSEKAIRRGAFGSVEELKDCIEEFLEVWNEEPKPFVWTATVESITAKLARCRRTLEQIQAGSSSPRPEAALKDAYHRPYEPRISEEAKAWVVHLACCKPKELGYSAELWTRSALARHVRQHAVEAGYPALAQAAKATVHRILASQPLHPEKVKYYLQRRDPQFESKMRQVLLVYREVALQNESSGEDGPSPGVITVSVDEKPGVQAIANTAPELPPVPGRHPCTARDHEYKRLGTCSILAALDLHDGRVTARVERRHRSREFILLLKDLDQTYPAGCTIRLILDNHSAHISKETKAYLATRPNRFKYVHTPTHGSWLNIVETLFGKMARTFLKSIRVESGAELRERILLGITEINAAPVVHRWRKFEPLEAAPETGTFY